jgi:hypothetical protein
MAGQAKLSIWIVSFPSYLVKYVPSLSEPNIFQSLKGTIFNPLVLEAIFQAFLKFGQAIVDAMFVQKISKFWWTCGLILASRCTNFYKIPIFGLGVMPQTLLFFGQLRQPKKLFIF